MPVVKIDKSEGPAVPYHKLAVVLTKKLQKKGSPELAKQITRYLKNQVKSRGMKAPTIDLIFKPFYKTHIKPLDLEEQLAIALSLLASEYQDDKRCGIGIMSNNVRHLTPSHLAYIKTFIPYHVYEWATCDTLSSRVFSLMIKRDPALFIPLIHIWKDSPYMWVQRASCVSFVRHARHGDPLVTSTVIDICETCVTNPERFVQLGVGWVLRELSQADLGLVVRFIKRHYHHHSREGLRYALEKMSTELRKELMTYVPEPETHVKDEQPVKEEAE
eukprot:gnl/Dysnectes_brevis/5597_a8123_718.p1 GENE.gnl/Dysnectes_brevis/5597_a8123_718~~gnl/Dysnectes_brevis/5597_a8123_718.p1  ORF type:complete len:274 (+),score=12.96 gnl/Dysnectes_brevis/5597_a8123_718:46-867(+)